MNGEQPGGRFARPVVDYLVTVPVPVPEQRRAARMTAELELSLARSRAKGFPMAARTVAVLARAAIECQDELTELDRQLDPIRHAPAVDSIFGAKRMCPLNALPDGAEPPFPPESWDPVAYPEVSVLPGVSRFLASLRMMVIAYGEVDLLPGAGRGLAELVALREATDGYPPGYERPADAARRTSLMAETMFRAECLEQRRRWRHQVNELSEIIDYLDEDARERTLEYMVMASKLGDAFWLMAGNRADGFAAWCAVSLGWGRMLALDLRAWIGRRANGTDRADGSDFPFADILNQIPEFVDIPKLAEDRDEDGR